MKNFITQHYYLYLLVGLTLGFLFTSLLTMYADFKDFGIFRILVMGFFLAGFAFFKGWYSEAKSMHITLIKMLWAAIGGAIGASIYLIILMK